MRESCDAIVAGHICLDIIPTLTSGQLVFVPGRLFEVGPPVLSTGGAVSNTGLALHKLGVKTELMGKVGRDLFGEAIKKLIARYDVGLTRGMIEVENEASSYTVILSAPGADRMFLHYPGCNNTFGADDIDYDRLASARLFHFGYPPLLARFFERDGEELADLFRRAKATGITTSLDMVMPDPASPSGRADWSRILAATLPYVDIFMPSLEETLFMLRRETFEALAKKSGDLLVAITPGLANSLANDLLAMGAKVVGLKAGYWGLYVQTASDQAWHGAGRAGPKDVAAWSRREIWSPCFEARVVGTTGAGDATVAGFHAAVLRGLSLEEAVTTATGVGGCNVEAADALTGVRGWEETRARIAAGWPRKPLSLDMTGWTHDASMGLWFGPEDRGSNHQAY
jgi:sugar/nucleoside kinase (ribokinase family)